MKHHIVTYKKGLENASIDCYTWVCDIVHDGYFKQTPVVERSVLKCRNVWKTI
jgi:hypothetical protein